MKVDSLPDVIALMRAIDGILPDVDGLKSFNKLYLMVTEALRDDLATPRWAAPVWLERLDVLFARLFFHAIAASLRGAKAAPLAWRPLLEMRYRPGIARIQFAIAGMNAHINRDLAVAVVETCTAIGNEPRRGTPWYEDYLRVNEILERVEIEAAKVLATGLLRLADEALGRLDDVLAIWSVKRAREAAWNHAEILWTLRGNAHLFASYVDTIDGVTGFAGRGLLLPTGVLYEDTRR